MSECNIGMVLKGERETQTNLRSPDGTIASNQKKGQCKYIYQMRKQNQPFKPVVRGFPLQLKAIIVSWIEEKAWTCRTAYSLHSEGLSQPGLSLGASARYPSGGWASLRREEQHVRVMSQQDVCWLGNSLSPVVIVLQQPQNSKPN